MSVLLTGMVIIDTNIRRACLINVKRVTQDVQDTTHAWLCMRMHS